tara:strand:- start:899 stop:1429 length:531 start_codon:yes stop_codon:yes gene_type:complete
MKGRIEIITGCMFAGKSTELINRVKSSKKKFLFIKPKLDSRYNKGTINTHSGKKKGALVVDSLSEIFSKLNCVNLVAIDEAQFFEKSIVEDCLKMSNMGINVIIAGLEFDYLHKKFDSMNCLLDIADSVTRLTAICTECGGPAIHSYRIVNKKSTILVGHKDYYKPLCTQCYKKNV